MAIKDKKKINRVISNEEAKQTKVKLQTTGGKEFGDISLSAYGAIRGGYLSRYSPVDENEKKVLDKYKQSKFSNEIGKTTFEEIPRHQTKTENNKEFKGDSDSIYRKTSKSTFETMPKYQENKQKFENETINKFKEKYGKELEDFNQQDYYDWATSHGFKFVHQEQAGISENPIMGTKNSEEDKKEEKNLRYLLQFNQRRKELESEEYDTAKSFGTGIRNSVTFNTFPRLEEWADQKDINAQNSPYAQVLKSKYKTKVTDEEEKVKEEHPIANTVGYSAGELAKWLTTRKVASKAVGSVKWLANKPQWLQNTVKNGITDGITSGFINAANTAGGGGDAKTIAKQAGIGAVGGSLGGAASSLVGEFGENILFKRQLQHKFIPEMARNVAASVSFAGADSAATYFLYPKEERPTALDIAKNMGVTFAFAAITTALNVGAIKQSSKEVLDVLNDEMIKDYEGMAHSANKNDKVSVKQFAKNVMNYSDSMIKYLNGEEFELKNDVPSDTVTKYLTGGESVPVKNTVLKKARFVGEDARVRSMQEDLRTIKSRAKEIYDRADLIPYDVEKKSETSNVGNVDNITKEPTNINNTNSTPQNKNSIQNVPKTSEVEPIQTVQEQTPISVKTNDVEVQKTDKLPKEVQDSVSKADVVAENNPQGYNKDFVRRYANSFVEVAQKSDNYPNRDFLDNNIADELTQKILTGESKLDGNSDFDYAVKQFKFILNQADESKLNQVQQFNENQKQQNDVSASEINTDNSIINDTADSVNSADTPTTTDTAFNDAQENGVQSSVNRVTDEVHNAMNKVGLNVSESTTGIQEANTKFMSNNDNLFDRNYVSNYANDFVQAMSEKNGRSYTVLSQETDNLADELVNKTLTGNSVLDGNREFQTVVRNFKDVLREGIKKNANLHNNVYGANEVLNAQVQDVGNGDYSSLNISENANNNIKFAPVSENGQNVGYVIEQGIDYTNQLSETSFAVKQKNGEYETKQGVTYGRFGTHQSSNGSYIVSYLPTGNATAILPNQDTAIEFMKQVENETSGYSIYLHNDNDGITKTGGEISQFINALNTIKSNLQVKENSAKEMVSANPLAAPVENATQKDNSTIEIPQSDIKTNETLPVGQLLEDYNDTVDNILSVSDETAKELADNRVAVEILKNTPNVILDNVKGARDLKVIINYTKLYLAVRKNGVFEGHYHNLGAEIAKKLPDFLQNPDAIIQLANGKLNLFTTVKTKKGNNGIISVELNSTKDIGGKNEDYNVVVTMFSSNDNYTKNLISGEGVNIKYKKEDLSQVNPQLYKWLATINDKSSTNNIVSQDSDVVNSSIRRDTENDTLNLKDKCNLTQTKHTKTGEDLWIIGLKERISADEYKKLNAKVKAVGGYYSRYAKTPDGRPIPGFIFKSEPTEEVFDVFNDFFGTTGTLKETTEVKVENDKTFDEQNEHKNENTQVIDEQNEHIKKVSESNNVSHVDEVDNLEKYTENMTPLKKSNAIKELTKRTVTEEYGSTTNAELIEKSVADGRELEKSREVKKKYASNNITKTSYVRFQDLVEQSYKLNKAEYNKKGINSFTLVKEARDLKQDKQGGENIKAIDSELYYYLTGDETVLPNKCFNDYYAIRTSKNTSLDISKTMYDYGMWLNENSAMNAPLESDTANTEKEVTDKQNSIEKKSGSDIIKEKPDLEIGDVIEYDGKQWKVTQTGLNMSFENLDKSDNKQTFSHIGGIENFKQTHDYKVIKDVDMSDDAKTTGTLRKVSEKDATSNKNNIEKAVKNDIIKVREGANEKSQQVANFVEEKLQKGEKFTSDMLFKKTSEIYDGSLADNTFTVKDAYDAMELGINQYILNMKEEPTLDKMFEITDKIPTQTKRTEGMDNYQQFSTPPTLAYLANYAANINSNDIMLEPSAGIGGIATFAKKSGAKVIVNELDPRRMAILKNMPFDDFYSEDAEQINNILGGDIEPSVVVMNPPFSSSTTRNMKGAKIGAKHIEEALKMLKTNGRLVAITGKTMADDAPAFRDWWNDIKKKYNVVANIGISGKNFNKYGTNFDIQMMVIDNNGATKNTITDYVEDLHDLQSILGGIRNERPILDYSANEQRTTTTTRKEIATTRTKGSVGDGTVSDASSEIDTKQSSDKGRVPKHRNAETEVLRNDGSGGNTVNQRADKPNELDDERRLDGRRKSRGNDELQDVGRTDKSDSVEHSVQSGYGGNEKNGGLRQNGVGVQRLKKKELTDNVFEEYKVAPLKVKNAKPHPAKLSESAAMSAVKAPDITYKPHIDQKLIDEGTLSSAQLEVVSRAGQCHSQTLPNGETRGFFCGDGTGVGKGRTVAGIILDNFNQGRKKAVWISKGHDLLKDTLDYTKDVFGRNDMVVEFNGGKKADSSLKSDDTILYLTYNKLSQGWNKENSNFEKIVSWLGQDFDGVIAFDEAHMMSNAGGKVTNRGKAKPSETALAGIELQKLLPKAKVIYMSATGATEVENLQYATRLGLWGEGTAFPNEKEFISQIKGGGISAMEMLAQDLKMEGVYLSRNISYEDVTYDKLTHKLTKEQKKMYNTVAKAWQIVFQNLNEALKETHQSSDGTARGQVYGKFWSSNQRFFNQILVSMQTPSVIKDIEKQLAKGKSCIIQLTSTNEAQGKRELARLYEEGLTLDDYDVSPKQMLMEYVEKSFPVQQYEEYKDEKGNVKSKPVYNSKGEPVLNREAVRKRDTLLDQLGSMKAPSSPIDMIINAFGTDLVAENTGRSSRVINVDGKNVQQRLSNNTRSADVEAFQNGKKRIMIFSEAGGTGKSYHASKAAKNQQQRVHYLLEAGWKASTAVQGFGRSHRSNQVSAPIFKLVTTDLKGQSRFISTIAKRLAQLGSLTKGQRQAGSQGMFSEDDNLENAFSATVLKSYITALAKGGINDITNGKEIISKLGLNVYSSDGSINQNSDDLTSINKFLNRILSLEYDEQNEVFDEFDSQLKMAMAEAEQNGTLDKGMENYKADKVSVKETKTVHTDKLSGADIRYSKQANSLDSWTSDVTQNSKNAKNKKLGDIVSYISKEFNIPISKGNLSLTRAKGEFKKLPKAVRLRIANDLPTATHELGHLLDDKYDFTSSANIDEIIDFAQRKSPTLMKQYKKSEVPDESVAEFVREFVKDPQSTIKEVPRFSKEFIETLSPKDAQALKTLSEYSQQYYNSDFMDKVDAAMTNNKEIKKRSKSTASEISKEIYTKLVDSFAPIKEATDYVKEVKGTLSGKKDAYILAINSKNVDATMSTIFKEGMVDPNGNLTGGKGLIDCIKDISHKDIDLFDKYLVLKHSLEWIEPQEGAKLKRVFSDDTLQDGKRIKREIANLENNHPEFKEASENLYKFQQDMLKYWVVSMGGMDAITYNKLQKMYPHYVPFMRDTGRNRTGFKSGFANQQSPVKTAKGSGATIISPLESIIKNVEKQVKFGTRNRVMAVLGMYADNVPGFANFIEPVPPDQVKNIINIEKLSDEFLGRMSESLDENDLFNLTEAFEDVFGTQVESYTPVVIPGKQIVTYLNKGKHKYYQVHDKALFNAITNLTPIQTGKIMNFAGRTLGITNALITQLNPVFATTNAIRDYDTAMKNSKAYNNPITFTGAYMSALWDVIRNSDNYKQYKAAGGGHMSMFSDNIDVLKKTLREVNSKDAGLARRLAQAIFLHPIECVTKINEITEAIPRLAEFKGMKKKGADNQQAIYAASDITVNFNRSGDVGRKLNKIFRFSNATVQGMDKQARIFTSGGKKEIAKHMLRYLISAILTTALLEFWNRTSDEDGWEELSQYQKNNFYCISIGNGKFIKIPKAREAAILNTTAERAADYAFGDKEAFYQFGQYIGDTTLPAWLPVTGIAEGGIEEGVHQAAGGTILGGIVDNMVNKDFKGTPIVSSALEDEPNKEQYNQKTSLLAKSIGQTFNWSPMKIDHLIDNYTGIIGKLNRSVTADGFSPSNLYGTSFSADSVYSTDVFNRVYEQRDKMQKKYQNEPTPQNACLYEKYATKAAYITQANKAIKRLSEDEQRTARKELITDIKATGSAITDTDKGIVNSFSNGLLTSDNGYVDSLPKSTITKTKNKQSYTWEMTYSEYKKYYDDYRKEVEKQRKKLLNTSTYKRASDIEKTEMLKQLSKDVLKDTKEKYKNRNALKFKKDE